MTEIPITLAPGFDPRPDWLKRIEGAVVEARDAGWNLSGHLVFEGHPYIWDGEPKMSSWTVCPEPCTEHP